MAPTRGFIRYRPRNVYDKYYHGPGGFMKLMKSKHSFHRRRAQRERRRRDRESTRITPERWRIGSYRVHKRREQGEHVTVFRGRVLARLRAPRATSPLDVMSIDQSLNSAHGTPGHGDTCTPMDIDFPAPCEETIVSLEDRHILMLLNSAYGMLGHGDTCTPMDIDFPAPCEETIVSLEARHIPMFQVQIIF